MGIVLISQMQTETQNFLFSLFFFETGSHFVAQDDLKLMILLLLTLEYWDYRHVMCYHRAWHFFFFFVVLGFELRFLNFRSVLTNILPTGFKPKSS
jgi:hypothetical protein